MASRPTLIVGDWEIDRIDGTIRQSDETRRLRPKTMDVLLCLAARPDELIERDEIISQVWGRELVTDEPLTTCIAELRRTLGDQATHPTYIQTVPKRGYRLVASVIEKTPEREPAADVTHDDQPASAGGARASRPVMWVAGAATMVLLGALGAYLIGDTQKPPRVDTQPAERPQVEVSTRFPAIAVLPFLNMSADPDEAYFGDGIAEEILVSLTKIDGLRVRSRTSSFTLKDQNLDVGEIARRLKVSHILEGSIRSFDGKLRVSAQLIDVAADTHVWSDVFDKASPNVLEVQGEIATRVSAALEIALDLEQQQQLENVGTTNTEAYNLYLRGRQLLARRSSVSIEKAAEVFSRAVDLDPNYAQAYLGLADANLLLPDYNDRPGADYIKKSLESAQTALRINPDLGEAYATLGSVHDEMRNFAAAEQAFQLALERAPRYPTTYHWYGFMLYRTARQEEAHEMLQLAIEQDPLSNLLSYGFSANLVAMGRFDEAEARYREIIDTDPEFPWAYEGLGELNWNGRGQLDAAAEWYQQAIRYDPDSSYYQALLGAIYLDSGDASAAARWIDGAMRIEPESFVGRIHKALLQTYTRDNAAGYDTALGILEDDPQNHLALTIVRNQDLAAGRLTDAKARYERGYPELLTNDVQPDIGNFQAAVDLALVLRRLGDEEQASLLIERSRKIAEAYPRHGLPYRLSDVKILVFQGRYAEALTLLERSIDSGWRPYWWLFIERDPALEPIRGDARYRQLVQRIRDDNRSARQETIALVSVADS